MKAGLDAERAEMLQYARAFLANRGLLDDILETLVKGQKEREAAAARRKAKRAAGVVPAPKPPKQEANVGDDSDGDGGDDGWIDDDGDEDDNSASGFNSDDSYETDAGLELVITNEYERELRSWIVELMHEVDDVPTPETKAAIALRVKLTRELEAKGKYALNKKERKKRLAKIAAQTKISPQEDEMIDWCKQYVETMFNRDVMLERARAEHDEAASGPFDPNKFHSDDDDDDGDEYEDDEEDEEDGMWGEGYGEEGEEEDEEFYFDDDGNEIDAPLSAGESGGKGGSRADAARRFHEQVFAMAQQMRRDANGRDGASGAAGRGARGARANTTTAAAPGALDANRLAEEQALAEFIIAMSGGARRGGNEKLRKVSPTAYELHPGPNGGGDDESWEDDDDDDADEQQQQRVHYNRDADRIRVDMQRGSSEDDDDDDSGDASDLEAQLEGLDEDERARVAAMIRQVEGLKARVRRQAAAADVQLVDEEGEESWETDEDEAQQASAAKKQGGKRGGKATKREWRDL